MSVRPWGLKIKINCNSSINDHRTISNPSNLQDDATHDAPNHSSPPLHKCIKGDVLKFCLRRYKGHPERKIVQCRITYEGKWEDNLIRARLAPGKTRPWKISIGIPCVTNKRKKQVTNKQTNLLSIRSKLPLCLNIVMQHMVTQQFERRHIVLFERGQLNTETFRIL